jgi:hypothetical protein
LPKVTAAFEGKIFTKKWGILYLKTKCLASVHLLAKPVAILVTQFTV